MDYGKYFNTRKTPQSQPLPNQVQNNAGGYSFQVDKWMLLDRFLILGTEGGSYYVGEQALTIENARAAYECIQEDGVRVVDRVVEISIQGRAAKNDPALYVLAMAAGTGNLATRRYALSYLSEVARTGTHLFTFVDYVQQFRGWGRALKKAVGNWYLDRPIEKLAYQAIKYRNRKGWTHADVLRKAHPKAYSQIQNDLFKWIVDGDVPSIQLVQAFEAAKTASEDDLVALIAQHDLPREALPTEALNSPKVWRSLLVRMPLMALVRNLGKLSNVGVVAPGRWVEIEHTVGMLTNRQKIQQSRIHPIQVLAALTTYSQGRGVRGSLTWDVVPEIVAALNTTYEMAFDNVEPSGKRTLVALDVSSSMTWGEVFGVPGLTPRVAAAAMAMMTIKTEPYTLPLAFSTEPTPMNLNKSMSLNEVIREMERIRYGGTDCALPMLWALENKAEIDLFVVYTDSETWYGKIHPVQALQMYREQMGIPAKLAVVGMMANKFSIADPNDPGMLDFVGFDTSVPQALAEFAKM